MAGWELNMARPLNIDLTGEHIGMLTVTGRAPRRPTNNKVYWSCVCDCGTMCEVQTFDLIFGKTRSCGCYRRARQKEIYESIGGIGKSAKLR